MLGGLDVMRPGGWYQFFLILAADTRRIFIHHRDTENTEKIFFKHAGRYRHV
jgi:hypothetical protein